MVKFLFSILLFLVCSTTYAQRVRQGYIYLINSRTGEKFYSDYRSNYIKLPKHNLFDTLLLQYDLPFKISIVSLDYSFARKGMDSLSSTKQFVSATFYPIQLIPHFSLPETDTFNRSFLHGELPWMFFVGDRLFFDDVKCIDPDQRTRQLGSIQVFISD